MFRRAIERIFEHDPRPQTLRETRREDQRFQSTHSVHCSLRAFCTCRDFTVGVGIRRRKVSALYPSSPDSLFAVLIGAKRGSLSVSTSARPCR